MAEIDWYPVLLAKRRLENGGLEATLSWTNDAKAELHLLGMNLHNLSVELSRQHPCAATILEGYANRIDELMKRAPEAVS